MNNLDFEIFEMIALEKGCDIAFPLKEKYLIDVVSQINERFKSSEGVLAFGGGTSLVCAYDELTQRFSEDADFRFYPKPRSTKEVRTALTSLITELDGFSLIEDPHSDSHKIEFHLEDNARMIREHSSLRPYIKVEVFFAPHPAYNPVLRPVTSTYRKFRGDEPEAVVSCVAIEETAIDKISSFLWRIYANETVGLRYHPSDMRHLNDLFYLSRVLHVDAKFKMNFQRILANDFAIRLHCNSDKDAVIKHVINALRTEKRYENDFERYVANMSYATKENKLHYASTLNSFEKFIHQLV